MRDQRGVIHGAGTAGMGIADMLRDVMVREGLSIEEAGRRFYALGRNGLLTDDQTAGMYDFQVPYARPAGEVAYEIEDLLPRGRDDGGDGDLAHGGAIVRGARQAAFGTPASRRSPACTRSERTARRLSSGRAPKQSSHSRRPLSSL